MDPAQILSGLNDEQRAAARAVSGPVVIHAGAGTGKTRVVSHRTALAAATGAMDPQRALLLTFTDKAAGEMAQRVAGLGLPGVAAMTFHKAAWRQLRHFWPQIHDGEQLAILSNPWPLVSPMVRRLPGNYRFKPTQDVLEAISWMKSRRVSPDELESAAAASGRALPLPVDLLSDLFRRYERAKAADGQVDFDDMILRTTDVLADHPALLAQVHQRYAWFSVDEFQDTSPAQFDLLRLWLGDRADLCVVGDENQTIYSFTGATSAYLRDFADLFPGAREFDLTTNYRSSPQILAVANKAIAGARALHATSPDGPEPRVVAFPDAAAELAGLVDAIRGWHDDGVAYPDIAVLLRLNADIPPIESALTVAGIPFTVRGTRFFERREVVTAMRELERLGAAEDLPAAFEETLVRRLGFDPDDTAETGEARERHAALGTLLTIVTELAAAGDHEHVAAALAARASSERAEHGRGVELATLHRAKGLEWEAVVLPGVEEGRLPVQQALKNPELVVDERRLFYVGITRARRHLLISWAQRRSRFLDPIAGPDRTRATGAGKASVTPPSDDPCYDRLKDWRLERSRADAVPAYVVFPNSTLALISRARPDTLTALGAISGVGPAKLERYGAEVLRVVGECAHPV